MDNIFSWLTARTKLRKFILDQSYETVSWVFACVRRIASSAASVPAIFSPEEGPDVKKFLAPSFPLIPTFPRLIEVTFTMLELIGGVLWWIKEDEIQPLGFDEVTPIFDPNDPSKLLGFARYMPGTNVVQEAFSLREVIPFSYYNVSMPYKGLSPLLPGRLALEQWFNMSAWNAEFFSQGIRSPLAILYRNRLTPEQEREITKRIKKFYAGLKGGQSALIVDADADIKQLSVSSKELDFIEGLQLMREEICAIFGVPPAMVGIFRYANYANTREQRRIFWEQTMLPKLRLVEEMLNAYFDFVGSNVTFAWDYSKIEALRPDYLQLAKAASIFYELGYSREEIAEILNAPTLAPKPEEPSEAPPQETSFLPKTQPVLEKATSERDYVSYLWDQLTAWEARWARFFRQLLFSSLDELVTMYRRLGEFDLQLYQQNAVQWYEHVEKQLFHQVTFSFKAASDEVKKGVGKLYLPVFPKDFAPETFYAQLTPEEQGYLQEVLKAVAYKTTQVTDKVRESLFNLVLAHLQANPKLTPYQLRDEIRQILVESYLGRAITVARTMTGSAMNAGRFAAWRARGVTHHKWVTAADSHVRDSHAFQHGQIVELGQPFRNGLLFPHDPNGPAKEVINCRCTTTPVKVSKPPARPKPVKPSPRAIAQLNELDKELDAIIKALSSPDFFKQYGLRGFDLFVDTAPSQAKEYLLENFDKFKKLAKSKELEAAAKVIEKRKGRKAPISITSATKKKAGWSEDDVAVIQEYFGRVLPEDALAEIKKSPVSLKFSAAARNPAYFREGVLIKLTENELYVAPLFPDYLRAVMGKISWDDFIAKVEDFLGVSVAESGGLEEVASMFDALIDFHSTLLHEMGHYLSDHWQRFGKAMHQAYLKRKTGKTSRWFGLRVEQGRWPRKYAGRVYAHGKGREVPSTAMEELVLLPVSPDGFRGFIEAVDKFKKHFSGASMPAFQGWASEAAFYPDLMELFLKEKGGS